MSTEEANKKESFVKGYTWGSYAISEDKLRFSGESKRWFDIPFDALSNVQQGSNKNEITLEFNKDEDIEDSAICQIKFYVPEKEEKEKKVEQNDEEEDFKTKGELLKEEIMKIANIGSVSGAIANIPEMATITPRGKFDLFFLKNSLKMNGQSHNYQIPIANISKVFLVEKTDGHYSYLIVKLKSPLTQGNTSYPFLIFQIKEETEIEVNLEIPENDDDLNNIEDFKSPLKGKTMEVIAKLFHYVVNQGILMPSENYNFSKGRFIKCSYKANDGALYFFEKSILFVQKPVLDIEIALIKEVDLARIEDSNMLQRTFDITVKLKKESYQFSGIERDEIETFKQYFEAKKIKLNVKDENNNDIGIVNYTSRRRAPVSDVLPELPSEEEMGDDEYSDSGEENDEADDDEDDEEEEEEVKKKKKKEKNKKKKEE